MQYGIPSFRLEKEIVQAEIDVLKQMGVEFKCNVNVGKDVTLDQLRNQGYKGFYVAIGAQGSRRLQVEGEDAKGVYAGVDFLNKQPKGLGRVVVIGGGNVAVDCARVAIRNAASTTMISLEKRNELPASEEEVEEALHDGVTTNCGWGPKEILAQDSKVTGIVLKKCLQVKNKVGKFNPIYDEEETMTIECDTIVTAIGQCIEWGDLLKGSHVEVLANGTAKAHDISVIKLERLQNIRSTTRTSRKNNHSLHTWSFYRLATFIEYKAKLAGIKVEYVDPAYTSQICPICGSIQHAKDRNYICRCGYHTHRDLLGAINICNSTEYIGNRYTA